MQISNFYYSIDKVSINNNTTEIKKRINRFLSLIYKPILIVVGTLSTGLGILGIFLPLLPTTPFLLLAAACYIRSSKKLYNWLLSNRFFGKYIRDYREKKAIPLKIKILAIALIWITISYSVFFIIDIVYVRILLLSIAVFMTVILLRIKTLEN